MDAGLPYDSPPPSSAVLPSNGLAEPAGLDRALDDAPPGAQDEPMGLDRPLDEYQPAVPQHVTDLLGRMSQGKVYLLEESPAIIHTDVRAERVRGDPRIADLAAQLDSQDPTSWLEAVTASSASPVRPLALYVESELIKHLSTSKVFSWSTSLGASPMGIEWLNDTTLLLLFSTPAAALLGLSLLAKAGFDPGEGDDPLLPRSAHSVPIHLLPAASPPLNEPSNGGDPDLSGRGELSGRELLDPSSSSSADPSASVQRRGRGTFGSGLLASDLERDDSDPLAGVKLKEGVDPLARIEIRYAVGADKARRGKAGESEWYRSHGRDAGKERSTQARAVNGAEGDEGRYGLDSWGGEEAGQGREEGREFAKRVGRERPGRRGPYDRPDREGGGRGGGGRRSRGTEQDLDKQLEDIRRRRETGDEASEGGQGGMDLDDQMGVASAEAYGRRRDGGGRRGAGEGRREQRGKDDLDKELDDLFAARASAAA